jgi:hypothetical protein
VENWIIITDLGNRSVFKLPVKELKGIIKYMRSTYRCRVVSNYIVNAPGTISVAWKIAAKFMDETSKRKIDISSGICPDKMLQLIPPDQLEEKYGGTAPNMETDFWPPRVAKLVPGENSGPAISQEEAKVP